MRTRLMAPALLLPALLLAACGSSDPAEPLAQRAAATKEVKHAAGTTQVPAQPRRIVTTTDQNALLPLLELGVTPVGSAGLVGDDGATSFRRTEGFDTSRVQFTGAYGEPNLEKVAALEPDLIVGYEFDQDYYADLSGLAPTVLVQIFDRPLTEGLLQFATVVGREDRARELQTAYEQRIQALRAQLGDRTDTLSVTVIGAGDPGTFTREDTGQALGTVMDDLGVARVTSQEADSGEEAISLEQLGTRDADVVLVVDYSGDGSDPGVQTLLKSPTYVRLAATRAGQAHVVDGSATVGAAWARMDAFLDVLEQRLVAARTDVVQEG
jgi:iron complex transport system substrate-binding protein